MRTSDQISIDEAVYRLIHHKSYRDRFLKGDLSQMKLTPDHLRELETIDKEQLCASAQRIATKLLSGSHQGSRGLESVFEETLTAWSLQSGREKIELVFEFLESAAYTKYHELPFVGEGYCIEQAFYEFIKETLWPESHPLEGIVRNEFLLSLFQTLAHTQRPNFRVDPGLVKTNSSCVYSVQIYQYRLAGKTIEKKPHFVLYATCGGQLLSGEITPLIADILYDDTRSPYRRMGELTKRHKLSIGSYVQTCSQLIRMGVLPPEHSLAEQPREALL